MENILKNKTIGQWREEIDNGKISCRELVKGFLHNLQVGEEQKKYNALISWDMDLIEQQVVRAEREIKSGVRKDLLGIPVVVKDNIVMKDLPTTAASKMLKNYVSPYCATVVRRLQDSGAIILGKANMDEFAMGSSGENSVLGAARNPWDVSRVAGGSSSGSTVAVTADYCSAALGSDTGGSIRQPASFCGITGLKPTYGRVSRYGLLALGSSLDQIGPLTHSAEDAGMVLQVIAGYDPHDSTSAQVEVPEYKVEMKKNVRGLRLGLVKEFFAEADRKLQDSLQEAIEKMTELGVIVEEVSLPILKYGLPVYYIVQSSECSANLARYDGIRFGGGGIEKDENDDLVTKVRSEGFGLEVKRRIMLGTYSLSSGYYDQYFNKAARVRTIIINEFKQAWEKYDLLCGLTSPSVAFGIGEKVTDPLQMYLADVMTVPVSLAGLPAVSIPIAPVDGLPVGMQIVGKWFAETEVLKLAYNYQQITSWHQDRPEEKL